MGPVNGGVIILAKYCVEVLRFFVRVWEPFLFCLPQAERGFRAFQHDTDGTALATPSFGGRMPQVLVDTSMGSCCVPCNIMK